MNLQVNRRGSFKAPPRREWLAHPWLESLGAVVSGEREAECGRGGHRQTRPLAR